MRGFLTGLVVLVLLAATVLSIRPGGLRRQLQLVGRRFRLVLVLGGLFVFGSLVMRLLFTTGPVADYGPATLAVVLLVAFVVFGQDPRGDTGRNG